MEQAGLKRSAIISEATERANATRKNSLSMEGRISDRRPPLLAPITEARLEDAWVQVVWQATAETESGEDDELVACEGSGRGKQNMGNQAACCTYGCTGLRRGGS
jgi:hypothetical protein